MPRAPCLGQVREQAVCQSQDLTTRVRANPGTLEDTGEDTSLLDGVVAGIGPGVEAGLAAHVTILDSHDDAGVSVLDDVDLTALTCVEGLNDPARAGATVRVVGSASLGLSLALLGAERGSELGHDGLPIKGLKVCRSSLPTHV